MQLNDTHLVLLSAAAQRDDKLLLPPGKLGPKAADKLAARLEAAGLVEAAAVTAYQPHWRSTQDGEPIGLRLTTAGLDTLGIVQDGVPADPTQLTGDDERDATDASPLAEQAGGAPEDQPSPSLVDEAAVDKASFGAGLLGEASPDDVSAEEISSGAAASVIVLPRAGSWRALLIAMLQREEGASVEAIMAATGWLPHSTRAALTGLRKAGHQLVKSKDAAGKTTYRLIDPAAVTGSPADIAAE